MPTLVVGSHALVRHVPGIRVPRDVDTFSDHPEPEWDNYWNPGFGDWLSGFRVASLDELYTIKVSHAYWQLPNNSWEKHMYDTVRLKQVGARLDPDLHAMLYSVWEKDHGRKIVNLQQDKSDFFSDAVRRIYDHDSIHYSVAYGDRPIYEDVFVQDANIAMDMSAIKAMPFDMQVRLYREEIYATALERWVIPSGYRISPRLAYHWAAAKTITSLTKGWSATFLVDNYETFRDPDMDYVAHHISKAHHLIRLEDQ
jgi:hypothetical protein